MPTYVYKFIDTNETIEVQQSFTDDTLTEYPHPETGEIRAVKKVFQPVGVTFKGSGFFKNDNRSNSSARSGGAGSPAASSASADSSAGAADSTSTSSGTPAADTAGSGTTSTSTGSSETTSTTSTKSAD